MDYIDEYDDTRPRYQFRGGGGRVSSSDTSSESVAVSKSHLAICFCASLLLSICAFYAFQHSYDILFSLLLWFSLSLLLAPFAPVSATGGSVYVGGGPALPEPLPSVSNADSSDSSINNNRRSRSRRQVERSSGESEMVTVRSSHDESLEKKKSEQKALEEKRRGGEERREKEEENDWTREDLDLLKKQMTKYSVAGDPNRWEKVASAFKGRHGLESVIRTAKSMQEIKARGEDPFEQFLKKRKPVDPRADAASEVEAKAGLKEVWSSGDDLALLNALKAFPKDVPMRWEKIAAAVPGKSKAGCMKRVSELKKDFRSIKAS